jgi:hypothetical protein
VERAAAAAVMAAAIMAGWMDRSWLAS